MLLPPSMAWKLVLAIALAGVIFASARARAPRRALPSRELRRLVVAALALYGIGLVASLRHQVLVSGVVYASGIAVSALAAWLSRGTDSEDPPSATEPHDEQPPPEPDYPPEFDWAAFERELRAYSERPPAGVR
jgi:hypothetical protein